jgi:uncharacterized protein YjbI with pentapeptide repeats
MRKLPLRNDTIRVEAYDVNLTGSGFEDALFRNATFKHTSLEASTFELVRFDGASMTNVSFEGCNIERASFVNCAIKRGRFAGMTIDGISVEELLEVYHTQQSRRHG